MSDLISRETMKDAIDNTTWYHQNRNGVMVEGAHGVEDAWFKAEDVFKAIENVPTAQPNTPTDTPTDLISRQAAIKAIENLQDCYNGFSDTYDKACIIGALEEVPSAQSEPIRINLNELIKVKLTDLGKELYYHQYDRINQIAGREICKPEFPKEDENGYTEFQLWRFIELYGIHIGITLPNVIKPLEIVYER